MEIQTNLDFQLTFVIEFHSAHLVSEILVVYMALSKLPK